MKQILLVILLFIQNGINIYSQEIDTLNHNPQTIENNQSLNSSSNNRLDYKVLYELNKEFNNDLISTVYWSLSSILVVILAIIGSNIFFNFKFNKKQYQELESELKQKLILFENKIKEENIKQIEGYRESSKELISKYKEEIQETYDKNIKEILVDYKERLATVSDNLLKQLESTQKLVDNRDKNLEEKNLILSKNIDELKNLINDYNLQNIESINTKVSKLNHELLKEIKYENLKIKLDLYGLEANFWKTKGVKQNALRYFINEALIKVELGWYSNLNSSAESILETLMQIDNYIYKSEFRDLELIIEKTSDDNIELKQKLKDKIKTLEIR